MLGFHDHYSTLIKVYLLKRKSDAIKAMKLFVAWCNSMGFAYTDNAGELSGVAVHDWASGLVNPIRITTCALNVTRERRDGGVS